MTPNERKALERKALVWQRVEKLLFSPAGEKDQRQWCACYTRSLARYWRVPEFAASGGFPTAGFRLPLPGFFLAYDLSEWNSRPGRASVRMAFEGVDFAAYDIDHAYQSRRSLLEEPGGNLLRQYPSKGTREDDVAQDVRWVLERFILHPCAHVHPVADFFACLRDEHEPFRNVVHEIRLGFGLTNPFAALFQLRLQWVLGEDVKETKELKGVEGNRVAELIRREILQDNETHPIPPGRLFAVER